MMGFLGASPDACVYDPHCEITEGIAEFKCPYSKREVSDGSLQRQQFLLPLQRWEFLLKGYT